MQKWGKDFKYTDKDGKEYNVKFDIQVKTKDEMENGKNTDNIMVNNPSFTFNACRSRWDESESGSVYAHETGHLLGFNDLYYQDTKYFAKKYVGVDDLEIMGVAASSPNAKVTQADIDALAKYSLK